jgi:hypothetical protein
MDSHPSLFRAVSRGPCVEILSIPLAFQYLFQFSDVTRNPQGSFVQCIR